MAYDGRHHTVRIGAVSRDLPLFEVAPGVFIAIFNMLGDTEVVEAAAELLAARLPDGADVILVPEVKAVPLGHALSVHAGLPYIVARKVRKPYMVDCLEAEVLSITTGEPQVLYIDGKDRKQVMGKRVLLVDDVISTGGTLEGLRRLVQAADAEIAGEMAVFTEGESDDWSNVIALGHLPVFGD